MNDISVSTDTYVLFCYRSSVMKKSAYFQMQMQDLFDVSSEIKFSAQCRTDFFLTALSFVDDFIKCMKPIAKGHNYPIKGLRKYWAWYLGLKCFSRHKPLRAQIRKLWSGTSIPILVCPWHSLLPKFLEHIPESFRWLGTRLGSRKQCSSWMGWRPRGFCSQTLEGSAATTWKIHSSSALLSQSGVTNPGWVPCWNISQNISPVFHKIVNSYLVQGQARGYGHNTQN